MWPLIRLWTRALRRARYWPHAYGASHLFYAATVVASGEHLAAWGAITVACFILCELIGGEP